jgi:hypothetical protein
VAAVASRENADVLAFGSEPLGDPDHHRRLSCAACGEIAYADYVPGETLLLEDA